MGCDSKLQFPTHTKHESFTDVLGALLGAKIEKRVFDGGYSAHVEPLVKLRKTDVDAAYYTVIVDGKIGGHWFFDASDYNPFGTGPMFMCATGEHRRAVLEALCDIFGGALDFNDCDGVEFDYHVAVNNLPYRPNATDGKAWEQWQDKKLSVEAISAPEEWFTW